MNTEEASNVSLKYRKTPLTPFIIFITIGGLIMLLPVFINMGHPVPIIFSELIGLPFLYVGIAGIIDNEKRHKKITWLFESGKKCKGVVTSVQRRSRTNSAGAKRLIYNYCVECEVINPDTNEKYFYNSEWTTFPLSRCEGRQVIVYFDPADPARYYVDLDSLR